MANLTGFPIVRAHWVDVGGLSTGFGALGSADPWSEGLQFNQLKIYEAGKPDKKLLQMISDNIRFPEAAMGDLRSQIAACRLAERRLEELYKRYGTETIAAAMEIIYSETERKCRAVVETIPDGVYEADNYVDAPGAKEPLVHIHVKVTVSGQRHGDRLHRHAAADRGQQQFAHAGRGLHRLQGTDDATRAGQRRLVPRAESHRAGRLHHDGELSRRRWRTGRARFRVRSMPCFKALAPAIPERIPAGHFGYMMIGRSFTGYDPRRGKKLRPADRSTAAAGAGGRRQDGPSGSVTVCQGDVRNAPIESIEQKCPVIVEARELLPDTGGPGKYRGGLGLRLQVRALEEGRWGLPPHRRNTYPPWGLWGGKLGRGGSNWVKTPEDTEWKQTGIYRLPVEKQTVIRAQTTGGGGWGDPLERQPSLVLTDYLNRYVSQTGRPRRLRRRDRRRDQIDLAATDALRQKMREETKAGATADAR